MQIYMHTNIGIFACKNEQCTIHARTSFTRLDGNGSLSLNSVSNYFAVLQLRPSSGRVFFTKHVTQQLDNRKFCSTFAQLGLTIFFRN